MTAPRRALPPAVYRPSPPVYRPLPPVSSVQARAAAPPLAGGARRLSPVASQSRRIIQLAREYPRHGGVNRGSGLTADAPSPYGLYHLHVIPDAEGLGLIDKVFVRFVGRRLATST